MRAKDFLLYNLEMIEDRQTPSNVYYLDDYRKPKERHMHLYIDLTAHCLTDESGSSLRGWRGYDSIEAVGGNLKELLEDATVILVDQDGGEAGFIAIEDSPHSTLLESLVREKFKSLMEMSS